MTAEDITRHVTSIDACDIKDDAERRAAVVALIDSVRAHAAQREFADALVDRWRPGIRDHVRDLAHELWQREISTEPTVARFVDAGRWWVDRGVNPDSESEIDREDFASYPANFGWYTRDNARSRAIKVDDLLPSGDGFDVLFAAAISAQRLRFEGRHVDLARHAGRMHKRWRDDPMVDALRVLGILGSTSDEARARQAASAVDSIVDHEQCFGRARHVCLEALFVGHPLGEEQAARLLALSERMLDPVDFDDGSDPNLHRRRAYGFQLLSQWAEAFSELNAATAAVREHHDRSVLQDIQRGRESVVASRSLAAVAAQQRATLEREADALRGELAAQSKRQLTTTMTSLGVFAAVIALVSSATAVARDDARATEDALLLIGGLAVALALFIAVMALILHKLVAANDHVRPDNGVV